MEDSHAPTHSTRRGRQVLSRDGDSNMFYKVIIIFNFIMTIISTLLNKTLNECSAPSSQNQTATIDRFELRITLFIYPLLLYMATAVAHFLFICPKSLRQCSSISSFLKIVENVCLYIAGLSYLAGDNIRILLGTFETKIPPGSSDSETEVKDLRSYIVAFSLCLMIISRIMPMVLNSMTEIRRKTIQVVFLQKDKKNSNRKSIELCSSKTSWMLSIPAGYNPKRKSDVELPLSLTTEGEGLNVNSNHETSTLELVTKSPNLEYYDAQVCILGKFVQKRESKLSIERFDSVELTIKDKCKETKLTMEGTFLKSKTSTNSGSVEFQISDYAISCKEGASKTAISILFDFYVKLLDFALIADAFYTTILDEITQQKKDKLRGCECPQGHQVVAFCIFSLLFAMWIFTIGLKILYVIYLEGLQVQCHMPSCHQHQLDEETEHDKHTLGKHWDSTWLFCEEKIQEAWLKFKKIKSYSLKYKILTVFFAVFAWPIIILLIMASNVIYIFITLLGILFVILLCFGPCMLSLSLYTSICCRQKYRHLCTAAVVAIITATFAILIYLPVYLIADNKWPWICIIDGDDKSSFNLVTYIFTGFTIITSVFFTIYQAFVWARDWLDEQNYKKQLVGSQDQVGSATGMRETTEMTETTKLIGNEVLESKC